jgi:hypothetical protein
MCSLYRMVVFPAASSPSITTRISLFPNSLSNACLNDLNTVCADGAFPIVAGRFRRRTRATTRLRRAERAPSRRLPRPLSPREPRESPSASGGRARGPGAPTAPDLARRRLTRTGGTKRVHCDDDDSREDDFRSTRSLVSVSRTLGKIDRVADLSRLGNCPYERTHHFSAEARAHPRLRSGRAGGGRFARGPHTGRARPPRLPHARDAGERFTKVPSRRRVTASRRATELRRAHLGPAART